MSNQRSPGLCVSNFLNELLSRLYLKVACRTTYISGIDVIRQLEQYKNDGRLSETTHFVTFDVTDLYTMIPRNGAIEALARFLSKHLKNGAIGNLKIDTILRLARLVLDTNCFSYAISAMGSPFTMAFADIYMLEWEQPLIEHQQRHNELCGR